MDNTKCNSNNNKTLSQEDYINRMNFMEIENLWTIDKFMACYQEDRLEGLYHAPTSLWGKEKSKPPNSIKSGVVIQCTTRHKMDYANKSMSFKGFDCSFSAVSTEDGHFVFVKALFDIQNSSLHDFIKLLFSEHFWHTSQFSLWFYFFNVVFWIVFPRKEIFTYANYSSFRLLDVHWQANSI